jgi:eukaryotic-like serine/threonine-protein kinase
MTAMDNVGQRRYETAYGLAMDVSRYLASGPVVAASPGAAYCFGTLARRHRRGVVAGALVTMANVLGLGAALSRRSSRCWRKTGSG